MRLNNIIRMLRLLHFLLLLLVNRINGLVMFCGLCLNPVLFVDVLLVVTCMWVCCEIFLIVQSGGAIWYKLPNMIKLWLNAKLVWHEYTFMCVDQEMLDRFNNMLFILFILFCLNIPLMWLCYFGIINILKLKLIQGSILKYVQLYVIKQGTEHRQKLLW